MDFAFYFQKLCQVETRRLLLVIGILVGTILVMQSSSLPYGNVLSSLFPSRKSSLLGRNSSTDGSLYPKSIMVSNLSSLNESNPANSSLYPRVGNNAEVSDMLDNSQHDIGSIDKDRERKNDEGPMSSRKPVIDATLENERAPAPAPAPRQVYESGSTLTLQKVGAPEAAFSSFPPALPPDVSSSYTTSLRKPEENSSAPTISISTNMSSMEKHATPTPSKDGNPGILDSASVTPGSSSTMTYSHEIRRGEPMTPISKMNSLLLQRRTSSHSVRPQWPSECDQELLFAKSQIENSPVTKIDPELCPDTFRNASMFKRSFELMERILKVYIYREGERPIFHEPTLPILKGIYASEGWFMKLMEANKHFVVEDPSKAHLFYMPFSSRMLQLTLYVRDSHKRNNLAEYLKNYVHMIASRHPFWNRTGGADHFLVACHDWAPFETRQHMDNCIKVLCNANAARDFIIGKDVTLPETQVRKVDNPLRDLGGKPPSERSILAFFAGGMHGHLRPVLLKYWENDSDMKIYGQMPNDTRGMNYIQHMKSSKYCICARGYDVNSPRVVEAIFFECVPVIISDDYVPPFFEVLDWESFAIFVQEKDVPKLKDILLSVPEGKYLEMHSRVKKVQQHFLWHNEPVKYDMFHMILHSVWFNRLNQI